MSIILKLNNKIYNFSIIKRAIKITKIKFKLKKTNKNYYKIYIKENKLRYFLNTLIYLKSNEMAMLVNRNKIKSLYAYVILNAFKKNEK